MHCLAFGWSAFGVAISFFTIACVDGKGLGRVEERRRCGHEEIFGLRFCRLLLWRSRPSFSLRLAMKLHLMNAM